MRAVISARPGGPQTLELVEEPVPQIGAGEVLVAVKAAGLNFFDTLIIEDRYQLRPRRPFSPCGECAGEIVAVGPGVEGLAVGDRVAAYTGYGAARDYVVLPAAKLVAVPDTITLDQAASVLITYGTALYALTERARIRAGETLAVSGAAGGVGLAAVEVGAALGARVIACASSVEKLAFAQAHGAAVGINTSTEDLKTRLRQETGGAGADVVFDAVGGDLVDPAIRATGWCGRYLVVGFAGGEIPGLPLNLVLLKSVDVLGVFWGAWTERDPAGHRRHVGQLFSMIADGRIRPHIHARFGLDQLPAALAEISARRVVGKVVIHPQGVSD